MQYNILSFCDSTKTDTILNYLDNAAQHEREFSSYFQSRIIYEWSFATVSNIKAYPLGQHLAPRLWDSQ